MNAYGISYDRSMVIDQNGIIQYSSGGVSVSGVQTKINELLSTSIKDAFATPYSFELLNNYPNPFNPVTTIQFSVDKLQKINLKIFDTKGGFIRKLVDSSMQPGQYSVKWNGKDTQGRQVASGVYFYQLTGNNQSVVRKMQLLR